MTCFAALLLSLCVAASGLPREDRCAQASGPDLTLCRGLGEEDQQTMGETSAVELLQKGVTSGRAAFSGTDALALKEVANTSASDTKTDAAKQLPGMDSIIGSLPSSIRDAAKSASSVTDVAKSAAAVALASVVNSTFLMLQEKASALLNQSTVFKNELLQNVSESADDAIVNFHDLVLQEATPFIDKWTPITDSIGAMIPSFTSALSTLGQDDLAEPLKAAIGTSLESAAAFTAALQNASTFIAALGNITNTSREIVVEQFRILNATLDTALVQVASFRESFDSGVKAFLLGVADKLGVTGSEPGDSTKSGMKSTLDGLIAEVNTLVSTISDSLTTLVSSIGEAADISVAATEELKGGAAHFGLSFPTAIIAIYVAALAA
eukprot:CAMPEP_0197947350 /NCGR_PEP_ID=MMETSP1439-20131203/126864_1 /TAXON_ID=66791 /ORGANISM="Gonyaulax spinifera, Strain CCMP409" /LENGTH=380 /DNA_ID=CAMNT_0043570601 /DNA_START=87 /DNA_END=1229 /DNA_ORIENTATION=-